VQVVLFAFTGTLSVRLTRRGHSSDVARAALATGGLIAGGIAMLALASTAVPWLTVPLAAMFLGSTTVAVTVLPPIVAEIVPALQRGTALGACIGVASLGAIAGPAVFGHAIDVLGANAPAYRHAFAAAGVVVIAAAAVAHLLMRPREAGERLRMLRDAAAPEWARQGG
jgi:MFS family permease